MAHSGFQNSEQYSKNGQIWPLLNSQKFVGFWVIWNNKSEGISKRYYVI